MKRTLAILAALLAGAAALPAQTSPFVDARTERVLANEISGDLAFETLRITTQWHKLSGSPDFVSVAREVLERAKAAGLSDVRWIDQSMDAPSWSCRRAEAWLLEGAGDDETETKLTSYAEVATSIADFSRPANVTAELVDVGVGDRATDYAGREVRGRIVLARGSLGRVTEEAVWKRGAAGILAWSSTRVAPLADAPDQIAWQRVPETDGPNGEKTTFAIVLSARAGSLLAERLRGDAAARIFASEKREKPRPLRVRVVVESAFAEAKTAMVEARIPGAEPALPEIVLTGHLQESKFSANDDQSGVANVLEIGRALVRAIADGKLPRPRRGLRFWWCDEIHSEYRYFADHPGEERRVLANLNQDMVGARQSIGGRVQHFSRTPWSRPSFLSDVQESVVELVAAGNNAFLPAWQAGSIPPGTGFTKPLFSHLGSREPYAARPVPYFDSTDHLAFNDAWVGVPGTTLTNWPDENIHSSADDLWQIDATQLKRNAFVVAATAWWLANAGPSDAARAASHVAARGTARIAHALATGLDLLGAHRPPRDEDFGAAASLLAVALETERAAVASVRSLDGAESPAVEAAIASGQTLLDAAARAAKLSLAAAWSAAAPGREPGAAPGAAEKRLAARTPRKAAATLAAWLDLVRNAEAKREAEERARRAAADSAPARGPGEKARGRRAAAPPPAPSPGGGDLSPILGFEAMNWVDGKTDAATIARRVCAEAAAAGSWYYGEATAERVERFLARQAADGLIVW